MTRPVRPGWLTEDVVAGLRWGCTGVWLVAFSRECVVNGLPVARTDVLAWLAALLAAVSLGKRNVLTIVLDFVPFAGVLIAYDYLRGVSDTLGMPTLWHPQIDIDRVLFFGHEPTVWLQEHLKAATPQWYDVVVTFCYCSFFFLPYVMAAVMWWRSRADFYRWAIRFVTLSFVGFTLFALVPAAPPWAAAGCSDAQVAGGSHNPLCMSYGDPQTGGLLGRLTTHQPGAVPWVQRITGRGFEVVHLRFAAEAINAGQAGVDQMAAMPSLHLGGTVLFCLFMWSRVRRAWRPLLVLYPLVMTFSLVYSAEHYLSDCLAGAALAALVHVGVTRLERRRKNRAAAPDTLVASSDRTLEQPCPPPPPLPATTPSSI